MLEEFCLTNFFLSINLPLGYVGIVVFGWPPVRNVNMLLPPAERSLTRRVVADLGPTGYCFHFVVIPFNACSRGQEFSG